MEEAYIEKKSEQGVLIRVNSQKNTYLAIKDGEPLVNNEAGGKSIRFSVSLIIFVGRSFTLPPNVNHEVGFYKVVDGEAIVPFKRDNLSDVRQISISLGLDCDLAPIRVVSYTGYRVGLVPVDFNGGLVFVVDSSVDREDVIRLNSLFSKARIVLFRHQSILRVDGSLTGSAKVMRAAELAKQIGGGGNDSPAFLARVYLRELQWSNMSSLPYKNMLIKADALAISEFLNTMLENKNQIKELSDHKVHISALAGFYSIASKLLSFDQSELELFLSEFDELKRYSAAVLKLLSAQSEFRVRLGGHESEVQFFSRNKHKFTS